MTESEWTTDGSPVPLIPVAAETVAQLPSSNGRRLKNAMIPIPCSEDNCLRALRAGDALKTWALITGCYDDDCTLTGYDR